MIPVVWEADVPSEVRTALEPLLDRWGCLVPPWCQDFSVRYQAQRDARMAVNMSYRNRWAVLIVTGEWLTESAAERENCLRHELAHILIEPLASVVLRIISVVPKETPLSELCGSLSLDGEEAVVEDIAQALGRLVEAHA